MTDEEKERIAISVAHLPPDEAQKSTTKRLHKPKEL